MDSQKQHRFDTLYMDIAQRIRLMSHDKRKKVGAVLVKDDNIISFGWNGTPRGFDNTCEYTLPDGTVDTKKTVIHAEQNALSKLARDGGVGALGSTLYITFSPCVNCTKILIQSGIKRIVYAEAHHDTRYDITPLDFLREAGIEIVEFIKKEGS